MILSNAKGHAAVSDTHLDVYKRQTQVWSYVGELAFNMLVLTGMVKMADRVVREMMGL